MSGGAGDDLLALLVALLARVAPEGDGALVVRVALAEEFFQLADLAVGEGVHRVDDDRLDAAARAVAEHVVDDGDDVGEALARPGPGGEDVVLAGLRRLDGLHLVAMKPDRAVACGLAFARPEDAPALGVKESGRHQIVDPATGLEARADLDQGLRPQQPLPDLPLNGLADALVPDPDEALDVPGVVADQVVAERKDVHADPPPRSSRRPCSLYSFRPAPLARPPSRGRLYKCTHSAAARTT